jgi:hypothetical protein
MCVFNQKQQQFLKYLTIKSYMICEVLLFFLIIFVTTVKSSSFWKR